MPTYDYITIQPASSLPSKELGSLVPDQWPEGYYQFVLDRTEHETLCWLADHGYDADLFDACAIDAHVTATGIDIDSPEELDAQIANARHFRYRLPMELARQYIDTIEQDKEAYLSCNGSRSLAEKLRELESACQYHNP